MTAETILAIVGALIIAITGVVVIIKKLPKRVKTHHYTRKWRELQRLCHNKEQWMEALRAADALLDDVLKKKRFAGKTMGERMVEAQRNFSSNDAIWNAHKLAQKQDSHLKEEEVKNSLIAYRQALRDLGALK
jgi:hypothetical protein